jgi:lipopolysaccharide export system protein LptA
MNVSVERLRIWLLVGGGLLVLLIGAFLGYARYRLRHISVPKLSELGINVTNETDNVTFSHTAGKGGKTQYTIHAAKSIQHKDGKTLLKDVGIVLYGRGQVGQKDKSKPETVDRIYGKEFEYDENAKVIRSTGEVHIDLQATAPADEQARLEFAKGRDVAGPDGKGKEGLGDHVIHVKTSGLVYMEQMGLAATGQQVEFEVGGLVGKAKGAEYSSDTGMLILQSEVRASGIRNGQPVELTAEHAELDRPQQVVELMHARYVIEGGASAGETVEAEKMVAHLRSDGTVERMEGSDGVRLSNKDGGVVTAPEGEMRLGSENHIQSVMLHGGVKLVEDGPERQLRGEAAQGTLEFDKMRRPARAVMSGGVHLHERQRTGGAQQGGAKQGSVKRVSAMQVSGGQPSGKQGKARLWVDRDLTAENVELALGGEAGSKVELRDAKAVGKARLVQVTDAKSAGGKRSNSSMTGDLLTARFVMRGGVNEIDTVHGEGHTELRRIKETGVEDTSSGDSLEMRFRSGSEVGSRGTQEIAQATQQGDVLMTHKGVAKPGDAKEVLEQRATAARAVYDGAMEKTVLTGAVQLMEEGRVLWADRVLIEQQTGDSAADGQVKASYEQPGNPEPVHVMAARAELKHEAGLAYFYGSPAGGGVTAGGTGRRARLWQGGSQVEAPVLQFDQKKRSLVARGNGAGADGAVHTVLPVTRSAKAGLGKGGAGKDGSAKAGTAGRKEQEMRVVSRELMYSDLSRMADFSGGVEVMSADGNMHAREAKVYLLAAAASGKAGGSAGSGDVAPGTKKAAGAAATPAGQSGFMGGSVERMVATGGIEIDQPGRRATGEQLVYTAVDQMFVLTGTAAAPPKMMDETRGSSTGASLRFHAGDTGDNSVVVSNDAGDVGRKVRTETRVKQKP